MNAIIQSAYQKSIESIEAVCRNVISTKMYEQAYGFVHAEIRQYQDFLNGLLKYDFIYLTDWLSAKDLVRCYYETNCKTVFHGKL